MIEFYPHIKFAHIVLALGSGAFFALRGAGVLAGMHWPQLAMIRRISYVIDSGLLAAGLLLVVILPGALFANGWLLAKLVLVVVYIVLGMFAIRYARSRAMKAAFYVAALATFGMIYSIARAHHPLGYLHGLLG